MACGADLQKQHANGAAACCHGTLRQLLAVIGSHLRNELAAVPPPTAAAKIAHTCTSAHAPKSSNAAKRPTRGRHNSTSTAPDSMSAHCCGRTRGRESVERGKGNRAT